MLSEIQVRLRHTASQRQICGLQMNGQTLPLGPIDHPYSLAQREPCIGVLTASSLVSATAHNEVGCSGDHALDPVAVAVAIDTGS